MNVNGKQQAGTVPGWLRNIGQPLAVGMAILLVFGLASCAGCYDETALVSEVRSAALRNRLDEVDLGTFHTTLPHDPENNAFAELTLRIFGTAPRYRVQAIEKQLETDGYRLRHETLLTIRKATRDDLAEPDLGQLRRRIEKVVNDILDDAPITTIGFYEMRITYQ